MELSTLDTSNASPASLGYSVPGRFERHSCTLVTFPPKEEQAGTDVDGFRQEINTLARAISEFEPVKLIVDPDDLDIAQEALGSTPNIDILEIPVDCCWIRDNGAHFCSRRLWSGGWRSFRLQWLGRTLPLREDPGHAGENHGSSWTR